MLTVQLFADEYQVPVLPPEIATALSVTFELGCSTLLVLGLATRLATLPLLGMLAVIQTFVYPHSWSDHLIRGSLLLFLLTRGAGTVSLDWLFGLEPTSPRKQYAAIASTTLRFRLQQCTVRQCFLPWSARYATLTPGSKVHRITWESQ